MKNTKKSVRICLDKALAERNLKRYWLSQQLNIKYQTIDNYYKNKVKRYDSDLLSRICTVLDCGIEDIIEVYEESETGPDHNSKIAEKTEKSDESL